MARVGGQLFTRNWCLQGSLAGWAPMRWPRGRGTLSIDVAVKSFGEIVLFLSVNFGRYPSLGAAQSNNMKNFLVVFAKTASFGDGQTALPLIF